MNIVVLGGSPKGAKSVTMQYVNFLKAGTKKHVFKEYYPAANIKALEKDETILKELAGEIQKADTVLWAFPLYFGLVHGAYKRFIELIFEKNLTDVFKGKHCALLATSIHFFDHTAVEYIRGISEDMGMHVDEVHSAMMDDLMCEEGQAQCRRFFTQWMEKVEKNICMGRLTAPIIHEEKSIEIHGENMMTLRKDIKVGMVTESGVSENLDKMADVLKGYFADIEIFDLSEMKMVGGCMGCLKCGYDNKCIYEGKDDVIETYRKLQKCDVIVFAGVIKDRYLTAKWKTFIDRFFFTTHIPFLNGKTIAFVVSGPLRQVPNLRELLTGFFEADGLSIGGIVTDEGEDTEKSLQGLAESLQSQVKHGHCPPRQFLGEAGHKVFRDEIFGRLRGVFVADHKYYKRNGLYDFPQKNRKRRAQTTIMYYMTKLPFIRKEIQQNMADYMVKPYEKIWKNNK